MTKFGVNDVEVCFRQTVKLNWRFLAAADDTSTLFPYFICPHFFFFPPHPPFPERG